MLIFVMLQSKNQTNQLIHLFNQNLMQKLLLTRLLACTFLLSCGGVFY